MDGNDTPFLRTTVRVPSTVPSPRIKTNKVEIEEMERKSPSPSPSATLEAIVPKDFLEPKKDDSFTRISKTITIQAQSSNTVIGCWH